MFQFSTFTFSNRAPLRLSIVIPTLNEAAELPATLSHALAVPEVCEIIISDGGSTDATESIARTAGAKWLSDSRGRGAQLRFGAAQAHGEVVVLLHADTWLPPDAGQAIQAVLFPTSTAPLSAHGVVGGGFRKIFRDGPWLLRSTARWRSAAFFQMTGQLFGDQAIFIDRERLREAGGVPDLPLMEEFALCRELRRHGRLALAEAIVSTSGRTFARRGVLRTWWLMWCLQRAWHRGVPAAELARRYSRTNATVGE